MFYIQFSDETREEALAVEGYDTYQEAESMADAVLEHEAVGVTYQIIEAEALKIDAEAIKSEFSKALFALFNHMGN